MAVNIIAERLRELVHYNPETGIFTRLVALTGGKVGIIDVCTALNGYKYISIDGHRYLAHRLAWMYMHDSFPVYDIDHINCIRTDNRISNLRDATKFINSQNRITVSRGNKVSGVTGVSWHDHSSKWRARIFTNGKEIRIGLYDSLEDAKNAYILMKRQLHEGCTI